MLFHVAKATFDDFGDPFARTLLHVELTFMRSWQRQPAGQCACEQLWRFQSWNNMSFEAPDLKRQCAEDGCQWLAVRSTEKAGDGSKQRGA